MRLAALLAELPDDQLERLGAEHLGRDDRLDRSTLCSTLETVLRSFSFVRALIFDRMPPAFAALELLLDTPDCAVPASGFREAVLERTRGIQARVQSGELVGRMDQLRIYRRVVLEARRNELELDASETALLGVLRKELGVRLIEHFLIEHHSDYREYWEDEGAFLREMSALRSSGLLFGHEGSIVMAQEAVPLVRQALGLEMSTNSRRRLYERFTGADLGEVLGKFELKSSGSRDEKLERLLASYLQPTEVLRTLQLQALKDLARDVGASVSGAKDEVVKRLAEHFLHERDVHPSSAPPPPVVHEVRELSETDFTKLFGFLRGEELTDILVGIESPRVTGAKDVKIALLWQSPKSETSLLEGLTNKSLEQLLSRLGLRTTGSKRERISRAVEHFKTATSVDGGDEHALSGEASYAASS